MILFLAAAVARRLHDRDRSALWGLLPLPFLAFGFVAMRSLFAAFGTGHEPDLRLFTALVVSNMLYLGSLTFLIVQLASGGNPGPNRYGEVSDT